MDRAEHQRGIGGAVAQQFVEEQLGLGGGVASIGKALLGGRCGFPASPAVKVP